jgi:hypothetical protein
MEGPRQATASSREAARSELVRDPDVIGGLGPCAAFESDLLGVNALEPRRDLTQPHGIEDAVLQPSAGGSLDHELRAPELHGSAIDRRPLARPDEAQQRRLLTVQERAAPDEAPESDPIMGLEADLLDLTTRTGEVRTRGDQEKRSH